MHPSGEVFLSHLYSAPGIQAVPAAAPSAGELSALPALAAQCGKSVFPSEAAAAAVLAVQDRNTTVTQSR